VGSYAGQAEWITNDRDRLTDSRKQIGVGEGEREWEQGDLFVRWRDGERRDTGEEGRRQEAAAREVAELLA